MTALVNRQIPALYNGVSQQPATARLPSQCAAMVNWYPTVVDGLRRRAPSEHVARISAANLTSAYIHTINRDLSERYVVVITDGDLRVFDLAGTEKTVTFPSGNAYLNVDNAKADFVAVTVADYTFIVNKTVVVDMLAVTADQAPQPDHYYWLNRAYLGAALTGVVQSAVQRQYGVNPSGSLIGTVQAFEELPEAPANGVIYRIEGTSESSFASYYVRRNGAVWDETVRPGLKNLINAITMPHALVRKGDGTFVFAPFSWAPRQVGDEDSNPNPTFVGRRINDLFFYKNRLGFCVDENIVMSRAGDFGNFYRLTVLDLLDDATIDVGASETKVTKLEHAVPFDKGMMVFSEQVQFRMTHGEALTPTSAALDAITQYQTVKGVRPIPLGSDIYFASENGDWAKLYEYYVLAETNTSDASDVTGHVPKFIPSGVSKIAGSSSHDVVLVLTNGAPNRIYAYKFYWASETEKVQSAWGYWEFPSSSTVLTAEVLDNYVYTVVSRSDGAYLEKIALETGANAPSLPFQVFLDRRATVTGVYLSVENRTEFTLPYPVAETDRSRFRIVRGPAFAGAIGATLSVNYTDYTWAASNKVTYPGNLTAGSVIVGFTFESRYTFSPQYMKNAHDVAVTSGSFVLVSYTVSFTETAYFKTEVAPYGAGPDIETIIPSELSEFDGKTLGDEQLTLGTPVFATGSFRFEVFGEGAVAVVSIVNDSPYASIFTLAELEANWQNRSRTI